jgi:hypothetical protein
MRVFALTRLGRQEASRGSGGTAEERRVLHELEAAGGRLSSDELVVRGGEMWVVRRLKNNGLVMELTQSEY